MLSSRTKYTLICAWFMIGLFCLGLYWWGPGARSYVAGWIALVMLAGPPAGFVLWILYWILYSIVRRARRGKPAKPDSA
jgi:hypothetical protein